MIKPRSSNCAEHEGREQHSYQCIRAIVLKNVQHGDKVGVDDGPGQSKSRKDACRVSNCDVLFFSVEFKQNFERVSQPPYNLLLRSRHLLCSVTHLKTSKSPFFCLYTLIYPGIGQIGTVVVPRQKERCRLQRVLFTSLQSAYSFSPTVSEEKKSRGEPTRTMTQNKIEE